MTRHQQDRLTDAEKAWVARNAAAAPPITDDEIRTVRALIASSHRRPHLAAAKQPA